MQHADFLGQLLLGCPLVTICFTHRKDQLFYDDDAIRRAIEAAARFLTERKLKNVFVDIIHELSHPERMDKELFREPDGAAKKGLREQLLVRLQG